MPAQSTSLGRIHTLETKANSVTAAATRGGIELRAYESWFRVQIGGFRHISDGRPADSSSRIGTPPSDGPPVVASRTGSGPCQARLRSRPAGVVFYRPDRSRFAVDRRLEISADRIVVRKSIPSDARIYGLGEKTGGLDKRGRRYRMRNTDVWLENPRGIGKATDPLYASFPVFIVHHDGGSYGIYIADSRFSEFDFSRPERLEFSVPADRLTYYVFPGPGLPDVLRQYTALTGRMPLPALWSLGYHQCRWSYGDEKEIRRIARNLRRRDIPADAVWADIDYMDGYRVFTWHPQRFPEPRRLADDLAAAGLRLVTIVDPGILVDRHYGLYRDGRRRDYFLRFADGRHYHGKVWAGACAFPDFHRPATRRWWQKRVRRWLTDHHISGLWLDMNEPSCTDNNGPITSVRHKNGRLPHAAARNTYGLQMARATYDGMAEADPDARPFILTRAAFSGAQKVAALWCGDNHSRWEHMAASLPMLMNLGLSGMPFVGVDIGGFGGDASGELLARWMQVGAFYPFCRNHSAADTRRQEPWSFGHRIAAVCRRYLKLRYRLLPYIYTLFREAARTGAPVMRPLCWHYPADRRTLDVRDQFMLGADLLVAPVLRPRRRTRRVYLPQGRWFRWQNNGEPYRGPRNITAEAPLDQLPLFVRGGAVIPMWPAAPHTGAIRREKLCVHIWPGRGGIDFYEDDGQTRAYRRGVMRLTPFRLREHSWGLKLTWGPSRGSYRPERTRWIVAVHGVRSARAFVDGERVAAGRRNGVLRFVLADDGGRHRLDIRKKEKVY